MSTRILFVIGTLDVGGAERQLVELASHLDKRFVPTVCCLFDRGALADELERSGVQVMVGGISHVRRHRGLRRLVALARLPAEFIRLWWRVRRLGPAILHGFLFHSYIIGAFVGRLAGVPVIVAGRRSLSHFKRHHPVLRFVERVANGLTDAVVANSRAVREDTLVSEGVAANRIEVIYNGLDPSRFDVAPAEDLRARLAVGAGPVVLVVANLIPYKGHTYFLNAWTLIRDRHPSAVALLCGEGPARAHLEAEAARLHVASSIRFLGRRSDVPALLTIADVLVHPSTEEGFCNALLEAMAAGRPVVATDVGGTAEAVVSGETGWIVPARDAARLASATVEILERPDRGRSLGEAGRRRVQARFDRRVMVTGYEELYDRLLAHQHGQR